MSDIRITGVRAIATAPQGIALVVVRVDTNQPGLYGLGCATYTQRWPLVV
ncbi:MAG: starvation-sensing protein RspA, partial [Bacillota bacterium]|nr:starvation-sensing protein RspA [Bacillota bacterium]